MIRTLRGRLTLWYSAVLAAALAVFAGLCYVFLSRSLHGHHDEELARQAETLIEAFGTTNLTETAIRETLATTAIPSRFVLLRSGTGALLYRDPVLAETEPTLGQEEVLVHAARSGSGAAEYFTIGLEQAGEVRFICLPLRQPDAYVQVGDPIGDVTATLRAVTIACLPLLPGVLLLSTIGGWILAGRALAPMEAIGTALQEIQASDLSRRIDTSGTGDELGALVRTLNALLDRLERAFSGLRQFAGDVAHQLQTPLTVVRGAVETSLRQHQGMDATTAADEALKELDTLQSTIADLRLLALADAPVRPRAPVDLSALVAETAEILTAYGESYGVEVSTDVENEALVRGDPVRLKQVVLNLGENAVKYTQPGGRVGIRLERRGSMVRLQVSDTGIGIDAKDLPRLFDRLFRTDRASERYGGMGLGLAITKRIIDAHHGGIEVESSVGAGSTFTVSLPLA